MWWCVLKKAGLKTRKWYYLSIVAIATSLSMAIAIYGEKVFTYAGFRNGINLFAFLSITFIVSSIASIIYEKKYKNDVVLFFVMAADMVTLSTLGLNIAEDYVKANQGISGVMVFIACIIYLPFMVTKYMTPKKESEVSNSGIGCTEARFTKLENRMESIYLEVSDIQKSVNKQTAWLMIIILIIVLGSAYGIWFCT